MKKNKKWKTVVKISTAPALKYKSIRVWNKACIITDSLITKNVLVYTGHHFKRLIFNKNHIGYRLGEFILTRKHQLKKYLNKKYGSKSK